MKRACLCIVVSAWLAFIALAGTAAGHGGLQASNPEDGSRVDKVPRWVTMTFNELPAKDSVLKIVDGCGRNVLAGTSVGGNDLIGAIGDAQPGKWKASYRVISAEDGHLTRGKVSFTVAGNRDCNPDDDGGSDQSSDEPGDRGGDGSATPPEDDEGGFPVVPVAVGAAGLVIVGLVVRRVSAA
jgi:methionine-rich copper-binding protein CopC